MSKRVKIIISVMAAILLLTVGITIPVMAQDEPTPQEAGANGLLDRVADKLGIPKEDLVNAFKEAQQEIREEAFIKYLDKAVEKERITQEEADDIKEWWDGRPPGVLDLGPFGRAFGAPGLRFRHL